MTESEHVVEATCPDCHADLTGSKLVETVTPRHHPDQAVAFVYFCPECGRFFKITPDGRHELKT